MVISGDNIFEGLPECKSQLFFDRRETFSLQGENWRLSSLLFTFHRAHTRENVLLAKVNMTEQQLWQNHRVGMNLPAAALLCTFPFLPAPQNKHCMHSMTCITWEISRRFTHTQRSLRVCRDLHTWGIAAGCPPSPILRSRRVFSLRRCSSVRAWKCQRSHMFISSSSYQHTLEVWGKILKKTLKPETSLFETPTLPVYFTDQEATRR